MNIKAIDALADILTKLTTPKEKENLVAGLNHYFQGVADGSIIHSKEEFLKVTQGAFNGEIDFTEPSQDFRKVFTALLGMSEKSRVESLRGIMGMYENGTEVTPETCMKVFEALAALYENASFREVPKGKYINLDLTLGNTKLRVRI